MKTKKISILLCLLALSSVLSCQEEETGSSNGSITLSNGSEVSVSYNPSISTSFSFSASSSWTVTDYDNTLLSISPTSGSSGSTTIKIAPVIANTTNADVTYTFAIKAGSGTKSTSKTVTVTQPPVFKLEKTTFQIDANGGTFTVRFNTDVASNKIYSAVDSVFNSMFEGRVNSQSQGASSKVVELCDLVRLADAGTSNNNYTYSGTFKVKANTTNHTRVGSMILCDYDDIDNLTSAVIRIAQPSTNASDYESTDYSQDGKVTVMQKHSLGTTGFSIILLGEGFVDTDIADSTYAHAMKEGEEQLFAQEPMASLRDYCNVYYVNAVSSQDMSNTNHKTAFGCKFDEAGSSRIDGDNETVYEYAMKAVSEDVLENALIVVLINSTTYGGTTALFTSDTPSRNGVAQGLAVAYIPLVGNTYSGYGVTQQMILQHEAVGHGIGKLADEYSYKEMGDITSSTNKAELDTLLLSQKTYKMFLNVSTQTSVAQSYWSDFAADTYYASENIGYYEGGYTFYKGIYRPVDDGLMNSGTYFPAPDRQLVYKRVMNVANDYRWTYTYDVFKTFDATGHAEYIASNARRRVKGISSDLAPKPLTHPVIKKLSSLRNR